MRSTSRIDGAFLFLNGLLLFLVTFVPFPTALVSEYLRRPEARTAAAIYAGTYVLLAIAFNLLWRYASGGMRLLDPRCTREEVAKFSTRDTERLDAYAARLEAVADVLRALALETPPNVVEGHPFAAISELIKSGPAAQ